MTDIVQLHGEGSACDTISSLRVPIIFVPGVMGSRLDIAPLRTWDPDDAIAMINWITSVKAVKQWTRRVLRPESTRAKTKTEFPSAAVAMMMRKLDVPPARDAILASGRCRAIATEAGARDEDAILGFYGRSRNWASVSWGSYGSILVFLESALNGERDTADFPVYAFGYDWRKSNVDSGLALNDFIAKVRGQHDAVDAIVVTHSMGGLVLRAGLAATPSMAESVRGVIHVAQPSNGAILAYRRLLTGASEPLDEAVQRPDWIVNHIVGLTPREYAYNFSALPGPMQLLPNKLYASHVPNWLDGLDASVNLYDIYNVYRRRDRPGLVGIVAGGQEDVGSDQEKRNGSVVADFLANLNAAETLHEAMGQVAHQRTYVLYSTGQPTDHAITFNVVTDPSPTFAQQWSRSPVDEGVDFTDQNAGITYHKRTNGDSTVPESSAQCPDLHALAPTPEPAEDALKHMDLFQFAAFNRQVLHYVRRLLVPVDP